MQWVANSPAWANYYAKLDQIEQGMSFFQRANDVFEMVQDEWGRQQALEDVAAWLPPGGWENVSERSAE